MLIILRNLVLFVVEVLSGFWQFRLDRRMEGGKWRTLTAS